MQPVLNLSQYFNERLQQRKGCISILPLLLPAILFLSPSISISLSRSFYHSLRSIHLRLRTQSSRHERMSHFRESPVGLELDFSVRETAAFAKAAAVPRHRNFRHRTPTETADNNGLGASQSRFISFYLVLSPPLSYLQY